jgi:GH15 family glucan-1,4-alpha-glucosidase
MTAPDFKPIADYGLLSDCNTSALVSRDGAIDWLCMPRFDSPALFARILDPGAGHWSITPIAPARTTRSYRDGTLVLETVFTTDTGTVVVTEAMAFADGQRGHDIGHDAPHELLRLVSGVAGEVELVFEMKPRPEYGLVKPLIRLTDYGARTFAGPSQIAVSSSIPLELEQATLTARFTVKAGERRGFALRWTEVERPAIEPTSGERVESRVLASIETWRSWEREHDIYDGPNRERVRFSARVLKGLTYHPTGAIVAAASCSLPESVGHERNWDYRYAWMRDASLTMQALYIGTCPEEASDFVSFMTGAAGGGAREDNSLQIMYGVGGEHDLSERELPHLRGWRDSAPVRVGNGAGPRRSSTSTASSSSLSTSTSSSSGSSIRRSSSSSPSLPTPPRVAGPSRTRASGRSAARRAITSAPRSSAGRLSIGRRSSRQGSASMPPAPSAGPWSATGSAPRSWSVAGALLARVVPGAGGRDRARRRSSSVWSAMATTSA